MLRYLAIVYFALATGAHAQTVYVNSRIKAFPTGPPRGPRGIAFFLSNDGLYPPTFPAVNPCPSVDCETSAAFEYDGTKIKVDTLTADGGSDWFLVQPGDVFSRSTIDAGEFPTIINLVPRPIVMGEVTVGSDEFYLGVSTGKGTNAQHIPYRTAYGWVHLRPVDGVLTMVENVMSYNSRGIIVGTTTVVPEPAAWALVSIAGLGCLFRRRRNSNPTR